MDTRVALVTLVLLISKMSNLSILCLEHGLSKKIDYFTKFEKASLPFL